MKPHLRAIFSSAYLLLMQFSPRAYSDAGMIHGSSLDEQCPLAAETFLRVQEKGDFATMYSLLPSALKAEYGNWRELERHVNSPSKVYLSNVDLPSLQTETFVDVPNVKILTNVRHEGTEGKVVIYHMIMVLENKEWKVLYCNPSGLEAVFAKFFYKALMKKEGT